MSTESWYRSFCDGIEPRSSLAENAILEITKDYFVKNEDMSEQTWLSKMLWNLGLGSQRIAFFELAIMFCKGESRTTCCIALLGLIFSQKKNEIKINELVLDVITDALSSSPSNNQVTQLLMIFRFNALILMKLDVTPALIDAMEKGK